MYYEINEERARQARSMWSLYDYKQGSATAEYKAMVDKAYTECALVPEYAKEKALNYANLYAKKLADAFDKRFTIELMCPSILVSGRGNFPIRKKEKQNAAMQKNVEYFEYIAGYIAKIIALQKAKPPQQACKENTVIPYTGFSVVENYELERLQILFDGKPGEEIRAILKSNGFKWAPSQKAWQRQLTENALRALNKILPLIQL